MQILGQFRGVFSLSPNICDSEGNFSESTSHLRGSRDVQVRREPRNRRAVLVSAIIHVEILLTYLFAAI
jgi:hypothetical protein